MNEFAAAIAEANTRDMGTLCNVSTQSVQAWKRGETFPNPALVPRIAGRIGWPIDKLAGALVRSAAAVVKAKAAK